MTTSQYQSISLQELEVLLSPHDRKLNVTVTVAEAIANKDFSKLQQCLDQNIITPYKLVDVLIEQLEDGIRTSRFETHVNKIFELICFTDQLTEIAESQNRRIYESSKNRLRAFAGLIADHKLGSREDNKGVTVNLGLRFFLFLCLCSYIKLSIQGDDMSIDKATQNE